MMSVPTMDVVAYFKGRIIASNRTQSVWDSIKDSYAKGLTTAPSHIESSALLQCMPLQDLYIRAEDLVWFMDAEELVEIFLHLTHYNKP
tara:strand:- start:53 stop:319 length:267 start_codon:yes stop_codon:yes gene_type:complete